MDDGKKAAKAFVEKYFPQKQPAKHGVYDGLFSPMESSMRHEYGGQNSNTQSNTAADTYPLGSSSRSQSKTPKRSNAIVLGEVSESCLVSSAVDYGCRDTYYPHPSGHQHPQSHYGKEKKDRKEGYDYTDPENSRGEWWQGSYNY